MDDEDMFGGVNMHMKEEDRNLNMNGDYEEDTFWETEESRYLVQRGNAFCGWP